MTRVRSFILAALAAALVPFGAHASCADPHVTMVWSQDCPVCKKAIRFFQEQYGVAIDLSPAYSPQLPSFMLAPNYGYPDGIPVISIDGVRMPRAGLHPQDIARRICR